ncbi:uncharacterized protein LOC132205184 [Neocloeon triangulifer]|uniref:uncharacterized protein LOC132205184 n=1 Tax=Neocloeon triangulifer TaxID=2078957 RepID=UPI00286EDE7E|nr:uncharacterized protein LOC132205184 [Neocloeon triangulifer]
MLAARRICTLLLAAALAAGQRPAVISRKARYLLFPPGSNMGIEVALSVPVRKSVNVAMNIEANYVLPDNVTYFFPDLVPGLGQGRLAESFGITRRRTYTTIITMLNRVGLDGRSCLLRAICEAAETPLQHNGLFGDLLHVIFTPSSSNDEQLGADFAAAEQQGVDGDDCGTLYSQCPRGLFQMFTALG